MPTPTVLLISLGEEGPGRKHDSSEPGTSGGQGKAWTPAPLPRHPPGSDPKIGTVAWEEVSPQKDTLWPQSDRPE